MKKIVALFCLLSISLTAIASDSHQNRLEVYLKYNDWYVKIAQDEKLFFQILRDENDTLILRTCPTYSNRESNGSRHVLCASGASLASNSEEVPLSYDQNEQAFIGELPRLLLDDKVILKGNSDGRLQIQIGDEVYLPQNAQGHGQFSM